jgi:proton-dependent oligopeptide transporter, POT family
VSEAPAPAGVWRTLPRAYWVVVLMEFFERGAYYGLLSVLSVYLVEPVARGGLGFSKPGAGWITGTFQPVLYALPILSGVLADRFGFRRMLMGSFCLLSGGYFLAGRMTSYWLVFGALLVMALGAGTFKPLVSGTIARVTTSQNSSVAFGLYYWSINLGAFLFPLFLVTWLKSISWSAVFYLSAVSTGVLVIPALLWFRDPPRPQNTKALGQVLREAALVLADLRFVSMIVIYSGFWMLLLQQNGTVLWYLRDFIDMAPVNAVVTRGLGWIGISYQFKFDSEHVTALNGGTIIALQILISWVVKNARALPTMIAGIGIGSMGMLLLALSKSPWVFLAGMVVCSIGEMTAHPKYFSYVGQIAPQDRKATYMGYSFLYGILASAIGGIVGARLYVRFVEQMGSPRTLWLTFMGLGLVTMAGLAGYDRFVARRAEPGPTEPRA